MEELDRQADMALEQLGDLAEPSGVAWPNLDHDYSTEADNLILKLFFENLNDEVDDDDDYDENITASHVTTFYSYMDKLSLKDCLRYIAVLGKLSRPIVNMILAALISKLNLDLQYLEASELLSKPAYFCNFCLSRVGLELATISSGDFWYQGIETVLQNYFRNTIPEVDTFSLQVSIDGLPLLRSSSRQLWPILIKVEELSEAPVMLVAVLCGNSKPELVEEFLRPLVVEVNDLQQRGLRFGDKVVRLSLRALIADSPARAFAKATISFNGKHGCLKCTCIGEHIGPGKVIFDSVNAPLRTDAGFRLRITKEHHKEWRTPLEDVHNFDLIAGVPVVSVYIYANEE
ncbi:uncharacterized protein LOC131285223 [Anopheles ziemanni]|uniref:uncharacterized protein LOC131264950 n=1 Tax=Anopheles coustani TaxID=139045 RepID=UPI0026598D23|nr:uncharacterized protein LOC131264950 [Anopheles coustani]XP_058170062.1 uncharacterized protein LOC131285223 [Anopheles ziemanni]